MRLSRIGLALIVAIVWSAPSNAQFRPQCLHGSNETDVQAQRREEANDAMDLINRVLGGKARTAAYPRWDQLDNSALLSPYRGMRGPMGDLARKMVWGSEEPLPGWRIHYVAARDAYAFSLTDRRDPCRLTFASNETGMVIEGRPARRDRVGVVPLDSSQ